MGFKRAWYTKGFESMARCPLVNFGTLKCQFMLEFVIKVIFMFLQSSIQCDETKIICGWNIGVYGVSSDVRTIIYNCSKSTQIYP